MVDKYLSVALGDHTFHMDPNYEWHKEAFYSEISGDNSDKDGFPLKTKHRAIKLTDYMNIITRMENFPKVPKKHPRDYYYAQHYEVVQINSIKRIIKRRDKLSDPLRFMVPYEELFDCLYYCHLAVGHIPKSGDLMVRECRKAHANLYGHFINVFLATCPGCGLNGRRQSSRISSSYLRLPTPLTIILDSDESNHVEQKKSNEPNSGSNHDENSAQTSSENVNSENLCQATTSANCARKSISTEKISSIQALNAVQLLRLYAIQRNCDTILENAGNIEASIFNNLKRNMNNL